MLNYHNFETVTIEALRQKCGHTHKCQHCKRSQTLGSFSRTTAACKSVLTASRRARPSLCVQLCSDCVADWDLPGTPLFTAVLLSLLSPPVRSFEAPELHTFFRLSWNSLNSGADGHCCEFVLPPEKSCQMVPFCRLSRNCSNSKMCFILGPTERRLGVGEYAENIVEQM